MLYSKEYLKFKSKVERTLSFRPYDINPIYDIKSPYRMIYGERSNGKTYQVMEKFLWDAYHNHKQFAYIRRLDEQLKGKRGDNLLEAFEQNGSIAAMTGGEWDGVKYYSRRWYWTRTEVVNDKYITTTSDEPIGYAFALTQTMNDKGASFRGIWNICFDEFIDRTGYLQDDFVLFMNTLSTIIRDRDGVEIWMLGNTVNKYCPYFAEMGLTHAKDLAPGKIEVYTYGDSKLSVAVEHTKPNAQGKASDHYFAFDNPKLNMITSGEWELDIYPRTPRKYKPKDILITTYLVYDRETVQIDLVDVDCQTFVNVSPKTTPIKDEEADIVYSTRADPRENWRTYITRPIYEFERLMLELLRQNKWFYATNTCGELVRNYMQFCGVNL